MGHHPSDITDCTTKKPVVIAFALVALILGAGALWWHFRGRDADADSFARDPTQRTTIELSGSPDGQFTGYYTRGAERIDVSGVLPRTFNDSGIREAEFRKVSLDDTLVLTAYDGQSYMDFTAPPGMRGVRANMSRGWNVAAVQP